MSMTDYNAAANNYGPGAGFLNETSNPYTRSDQKLNYLGDILYRTGLTIDDLLGLVAAPEQPGAAPVAPAGTADLGQTYAQNPAIAQAFAEIDQGVDPITALRAIESDVASGLIDPNMLPQAQGTDYYGNPTGNGQPDYSALSGLLSDYASQRQAALRDNTAYQGELAQYNDQVAQYNDYFQPKSQFELGGSVPAEQLYAQSLQQNGLVDNSNFLTFTGQPRGFQPSPGQTPTPGGPMGPPGPMMSAADPNKAMFDQNAAARTQARGGNNLPAFGSAEYDKIGQPSYGLPNTWDQNPAPARQTAWIDPRSQLLADKQQQLVAAQKANVQPSQAEADNSSRLKALYSLMFGQAAPN